MLCAIREYAANLIGLQVLIQVIVTVGRCVYDLFIKRSGTADIVIWLNVNFFLSHDNLSARLPF